MCNDLEIVKGFCWKQRFGDQTDAIWAICAQVLRHKCGGMINMLYAWVLLSIESDDPKL